MSYIIGVVFGLVLGWGFWFIFKRRYINGHLKITVLDDKDNFTLFVDDFDKIYKRRYLLLKVDRTRK